MTDAAENYDFEQIKQDLATFLIGYNPLFRSQTEAVQASQKRLNDAHLSAQEVENAYNQIKKDVKGKKAQGIYQNIGKYLKLVENEAEPAENRPDNISPKQKENHQDISPSTPERTETGATQKNESGTEHQDKEPVAKDSSKENNTIEDDIKKYLHDKETRKYSDFLREYIIAKGLPPEERKKHLAHVLEILQKELTDKSKRPNLYRMKKLALQVYKISTSQMPVGEDVKELFIKLSEKAQSSYIKKGKSAEKDNFLSDLALLDKNEKNSKVHSFITRTAKQHIESMMSQLDDEGKQRYQELLKEKYNQFLPKEEPTKGEEKMTDETNPNSEGTSSPETEEKNFKPEGVWLKAGYMAGVMDQKYETQEAFKAAVEAAGYIVDGNNIFVKDGSGNKVEDESKIAENDEKAKDRKERKDIVEAAFKDKTELTDEEAKALEEKLKGLKKEEPEEKPLTIDGERPEEGGAPVDSDWIKKKIEYYNSISSTLTEYKQDETVTDGFKATFNGGTIHYTSPDNCTVSKDADLKIYETLVTEPDNKGRPVNFGPNLDEQQAKNLMVACLIHGNPIGANAPELSEEEIKAIRESLADKRPGDLEEFNKNLAAYQTRSSSGGEREGSEGSETTSELSEATKKIKEIRATFQQMKEEGKIAIEHQGNKDVIVAGKDVPDDQKQKVVDDANALIHEAAQLVNEAKKADFIHEKLELNRQRLSKEDAPEVKSVEQIEADIAAREKRDHEMSIKLGIIEPTDEEKAAGLTALSGEELDKFIKGSKPGKDGKNTDQITKNIFARLYAKANNQQMFDATGKATFDESNLTEAQKGTFTKLHGNLTTELPKREAHTR